MLLLRRRPALVALLLLLHVAGRAPVGIPGILVPLWRRLSPISASAAVIIMVLTSSAASAALLVVSVAMRGIVVLLLLRGRGGPRCPAAPRPPVAAGSSAGSDVPLIATAGRAPARATAFLLAVLPLGRGNVLVAAASASLVPERLLLIPRVAVVVVAAAVVATSTLPPVVVRLLPVRGRA